MYKGNKKTQYYECLICSKPLLANISVFQIIHNSPLCQSCMDKFKIINQTISFYHYPLHILYEYNDFFKELLYQYKGQYDYALKEVFLIFYKEQFKQKFKDYIIVVAPSYENDNVIRGFSPIENIALTFSSHIFTGLYKTEKYKQSDLTFEQRRQVSKKISIKNKEMLKGKKVLLLDDVLTSGETLKKCLELILQCYPQHVELMVIATKQDLKELELRTK